MEQNDDNFYEILKSFPKSIDPDPHSSQEFGYHPFHLQSSGDDHHAHFELSLHQPGIAFKKELMTVFPNLAHIDHSDLFVIPTFQKCNYDLVRASNESNWERNLLCAYFIQFGKELIAEFYKSGCVWADFTDPVDGLPVNGQRGSSIYPDVDGIVRLLKYSTIQVGSCAVINHPQWHTNCYPGTIFVVGSYESVRIALHNIGNSTFISTLDSGK